MPDYRTFTAGNLTGEALLDIARYFDTLAEPTIGELKQSLPGHVVRRWEGVFAPALMQCRDWKMFIAMLWRLERILDWEDRGHWGVEVSWDEDEWEE